MKERNKTKQQLLEELAGLRQRIVELEEAEEKLKLSTMLLDNATDSITLYDLDGNIVYANEMAHAYRCCRSGELIGMNVAQFLTPGVAKHFPEATSDLLEKGEATRESEIVRKDKTTVPVEVHHRIVEVNGKKLVLSIARDVTMRQQRVRALRDSEEKYRSLFEESKDVVYVSRPDGRLLEVNPAGVQLFGFSSKEEILRINLRNLYVDPADRERFHRALEERGFIKNYELLLKRKDGQPLVIHSTSTAVRDEAGKIVEYRGIMRDMTEHKRIEEALQESERLYRAIFENTGTAMVILEADTTISLANAELERVSGYSRQELEGKKSWTEFIMPEDLERLKEYARLRRIDPAAAPKRYELRLKNRTGIIMDMLVNTDMIPETGRNVVSLLDLTERKRAEEALRESEQNYRNSLYNSPLGVHIGTFDGETIYANRAYLDIFGFGSIEELKTTPPEKRYSPQSYPEHLERLEKRKLGQPAPCNYELDIVPKNGEVRHVAVSRNEVIWGGHKYTQGLFQDITDSKKLEAEQQKAAKIECIGTLAGGIAHDFNNMLVGILGNVQLAQLYGEAGEPGKIGEVLVEAEKAALRAKDLTQQLLTFSRGGQPVRKATDIKALLRDAAVFASRGANVRCDFSLPDDLWTAEVDEGQMNQVISNLVINACEAMPEGGIIEMDAENSVIRETRALPLPPGKYVQISLRDHGIGISHEHLKKIFDPYFTTKKRGSGLGLTTSYNIIKNHGGYITVESGLGEGTTFHIFLPASEKLISAGKQEGMDARAGIKGKILVMDDDEAIRALLGNMIPLLGHDVVLTKDGVEAIECYVKSREMGQPFDAVMLDLTVPGGMGGKDTIKKLLEIEPGLKAIVCSGYANDPIMAGYKDFGFREVVTKPFKIKELETALNTVFNSP